MSSQLNRNLENPKLEEHSLFDRIFRDAQGRIVIAQVPNLPLLVGIGATLIHFILPSGKIDAASGLIAFGALFTWTWQEIFSGVNYFRRALGLLVLSGILTLLLT
ncbi:MAG TPA: hypothetical protein IGS53_09130 [Leptolyngbyaceae cyanobacterium M33_DOE_097]|uniref:Uncharacterized protein n=1 Tax=Oscillatoriales cyanobacterium SpSt-418 TaxID=2282169 RepID=A0A7C3KCH3_9CYAN|nr:hypothetical protein [Leptolyngbyaceae cyanobacterium M33_DOE_097]